MEGKFIVFEGIEGSGKTTQIENLSRYFFEKEMSVLLTKEPSNSKRGLILRKIMQENEDIDKFKEEYARLSVEDRGLCLKNIILPALYNGTHVIRECYKYFAFAYQQLQGMPLEELKRTHNIVVAPDITFYLDIDPENAIDRIKGKDPEIFKRIEFLKELRSNYLYWILKLKEKVVIVNASKSIDNVFQEVKEKVDEII